MRSSASAAGNAAAHTAAIRAAISQKTRAADIIAAYIRNGSGFRRPCREKFLCACLFGSFHSLFYLARNALTHDRAVINGTGKIRTQQKGDAVSSAYERRRAGAWSAWVIAGLFLAGWTLFSYGLLLRYAKVSHAERWIELLLALSPAVLAALFGGAWTVRRRWLPGLTAAFESHTDSVDALNDAYIGIWIALAAGLSLYIELMVIRIHASFFQLFAYFKNVSLLSCFLGLGIGYARGARRPVATALVVPLLSIQIVCMYLLRFSPIQEILKNPISEQFVYGIDQAEKMTHFMVVYGFLIMVFVFNTLSFIPLGHLTSRVMMRRKTLVSYGWNLIGSLLGIFLFTLVSFLWTPPSMWVIIAALGLTAFLYKDRIGLLALSIAAVITLVVLLVPLRLNQFDVYSPYQILSLSFKKDGIVNVEASNTYHQRILNLSEASLRAHEPWRVIANYYEMPYYFKPRPTSVLIVGSGTGNDVAAAVRHGAGAIDAVEIDPAILRFGQELHPERPYQAGSVHAVVDDARAFIRHTDKRYDLIVYGLLDSHTLLSSGTGGVRLDSYVYTVEAFREARRRLNPGGILALTFGFIDVKPELGRKMYVMLKDAFEGRAPTIYRTGYDGGNTFLIGDGLEQKRANLSPGFEDVTSKYADASIRVDASKDDWPFFYMPVRRYPVSYAVMLLILLAVSVTFIRLLFPGAGSGFSVPCFFLGAGFMLVETKGLTELALVYGSTWVVISIVVSALLIMAFLANWLVLKAGTPRSSVTYGLLCLSLVIGVCLSCANLGNVATWLHRALLTIVLTIPFFFSGFAFSSELKRSASVAPALSSNLLGAMLGGFLEYNSMYFGFRSLYIIAIAMYILAFLGSTRTRE